MARPKKSGLAYFPLDVDFFEDLKVEDLLDKHGPLGLAIYQALLCLIYKNGYYLAAPLDIVARQVIRMIGSKWARRRDTVLQVIRSCADIGLIDKALLSQDVITSVGVQLRYAEATLRSGVKVDKYSLISTMEKNGRGEALESAPKIGVSVAETPISVAETPISVAEMAPKLNKSKLDKENNNITKERPSKVSLDEVKAYAVGMGYGEEIAVRFHRYYTAQGWRKVSGAIIHDWHPLLDEWVERANQRDDHGGFDADEAMAKAMERSYKR